MIARRTVILFTAASLGLAATGANASEDLLGDILRGVADAFTRDYIRHHYRDGHWDRPPFHGRRIPPLFDRTRGSPSARSAPSDAASSSQAARSRLRSGARRRPAPGARSSGLWSRSGRRSASPASESPRIRSRRSGSAGRSPRRTAGSSAPALSANLHEPRERPS